MASVASHARGTGSVPVIDEQHLEAAHRHFGMWQAEQALEWAGATGTHVRHFWKRCSPASKFANKATEPTLAWKKLARDFGSDRLDAACRRAIEIGAHSVATSVRFSATTLSRAAGRPSRAPGGQLRSSEYPRRALLSLMQDLKMLTHDTLRKLNEMKLSAWPRASRTNWPALPPRIFPLRNALACSPTINDLPREPAPAAPRCATPSCGKVPRIERGLPNRTRVGAQ